ncbi:hypothetical protein ABS71_09185 [bacterium SCN 62-11]|nr:helix-turn-helix transcriptional regulator [Candidatus Eremiobacteraeota bacterium]ODT69190.1 MAG: hypothetical protein ABS71_09185 [bacterium SCN 62-11]
MSYLQKRREELDFSQTKVAQSSGMSRAHYQRIEDGRCLPGPEQDSALEAVLGIPVLSERHLIQASERRELSKAGLFVAENHSRSTWQQASRSYGMQGLDQKTWSQLSFFYHTDSALECSALAQLVAAGAEIRLDSPLLWGFRHNLPVDAHDRFLGAAHLPCLLYRKGSVTMAVWPQFRLRPSDVTWRLDGLVFFRDSSGRRWLALEFDGRGHDARLDLYRAHQIQLPEVRISGDEIVERRVFELLLERAPSATLPDFSPLRR